MKVIDRDVWPPDVVSYCEEAALREFMDDRATFFKRGALLAVPVPSGVDRAALESLVAAITNRHAIFRTAYDTTAGELSRHILDSFPHQLVAADHPADSSSPGEDRAYLMPDDLLRFWLTRGPDGARVLSVQLNEMITDPWSCARLRRELEDLFAGGSGAAGRTGAAGPAGAPPLGYADYARYERSRPMAAETARYWRRTLVGVEEECCRPGRDGPDPSGDIAGEWVRILPDHLTQVVRELCRRERVSPFVLVTAIVNMAVAALYGVRDIVLCTAASTRPPRWADVQGNFSNLLPLRTKLPANPTFADVIARSRDTVLGALRHQPAPYLELAALLELPVPAIRIHYLPHRAHHYSALDSRPSGAAWREDPEFAGWPVDVGFAEDVHGRVAVWASYDPRQYRHATVAKLVEAGSVLLELAAAGAGPALTGRDVERRLETAGNRG